MDSTILVHNLNRDLQTDLPQCITQDDLEQKLSEFINYLIETDFQKLVLILYKADVSEDRLKSLLRQAYPSDSAPLIAKLIIERELQKINSRSQFSSKDDVGEEEKW